jgi:type I restriction enzyme S subunit
MSGLPKGWACTTLGEVIELKYGKALPDRVRSGAGFPVFGSNGIVGYHKPALTAGETIIVGRKGSVGEVNFSKIPCSPIDTTYFVDKYPSKNPRYWYYKLRQLNLGKLNKSTAIPGFNRGDAYALMIMVPPIAEQKRITDKLDVVLTHLDICRERLDRTQRILKQFRQSVLTAATHGRLTAKWRLGQSIKEDVDSVYAYLEKNLEKLQEKLRGKRIEEIVTLYNSISYNSDSLPDGWANCPVGMIGIVSNGSTPLRAERNFWEGHIPWVSSGEVKNCIIHKSNECISELGFQSTSVRILPVGSVLIAMIGEGKTRGQSAILEIEATINQNIAAVVPFADGLISKYLWYSFQEKYEENRREGNGTGPQALNCQRVRELTLNLPPLAEQHEIVKRIEALFSVADRLEARLATACTTVDRLTPALLAKAFRGELVPQDPGDEPASELLARLAASRAAETAKPRRTRTAKA